MTGPPLHDNGMLVADQRGPYGKTADIFLNENESEMTKSGLLRHFFGGFSSVNFRDNILTKRRAREATKTAGRAPRHTSET